MRQRGEGASAANDKLGYLKKEEQNKGGDLPESHQLSLRVKWDSCRRSTKITKSNMAWIVFIKYAEKEGSSQHLGKTGKVLSRRRGGGRPWEGLQAPICLGVRISTLTRTSPSWERDESRAGRRRIGGH